MDELLLQRLARRNEAESRFGDLFRDVVHDGSITGPQDAGDQQFLIDTLREQLFDRERRLATLQEILETRMQDTERLNDELLSMHIENNLLQQRLESLTQEHEKLVQRWLRKVQQEVDAVNAGLKE